MKTTKSAENRLRHPYDLAGGILNYESGLLTDDQTVELFQHLINNGSAWRLQGHYGCTARRLIDAGLCVRPSGESSNG
jgi:hypothetical protein